MAKIVYVTGCLGFIGFHVTKKCLDLGWWVRGIDSCTYAANLPLLDELSQYEKFVFEQKDINDLDRLYDCEDRKSTRLNSSHSQQSRMPSSA